MLSALALASSVADGLLQPGNGLLGHFLDALELEELES
jgi:hypothetical protein